MLLTLLALAVRSGVRDLTDERRAAGRRPRPADDLGFDLARLVRRPRDGVVCKLDGLLQLGPERRQLLGHRHPRRRLGDRLRHRRPGRHLALGALRGRRQLQRQDHRLRRAREPDDRDGRGDVIATGDSRAGQAERRPARDRDAEELGHRGRGDRPRPDAPRDPTADGAGRPAEAGCPATPRADLHDADRAGAGADPAGGAARRTSTRRTPTRTPTGSPTSRSGSTTSSRWPSTRPRWPPSEAPAPAAAC